MKKGHPVEILLVEDNLSDVELMLHTLEKHNLANRIHVVRDGVEALDYIYCTGDYSEQSVWNPPKMILLDLKLPRLDGMEVLRTVKTNPHTQSIPVVMLSSSREEQDVQESYELGVNSYIVKPVDFFEFSEAVLRVGLYWVFLNQSPFH